MREGGAARVADAIASLLQQKGMQSHELTHALALGADATVTPGAEGAFVASLKTLVQEIETGVEQRITDDQTATQTKLNDLFRKLQTAGQQTTDAKQESDLQDKNWFECVAAEQAKREAFEDATKKHTTSRSNEKEACQLQQDASDFNFDATGKYRMNWTCDHSLGDCDENLQTWSVDELKRMEQDADSALKAAMAEYTTLKAACDAKKQERAEAQSAHAGAEAAWKARKQMCLKVAPTRKTAMCDHGSKMQAKCLAQSAFEQLVAASKKPKGDHYSEVDRSQEWTVAATTKCLVGKYIAKGFDNAVTAADMDACASGANFEDAVSKLNRREKEFAALAASNSCSAGPISFYNGQTWEVPAGPKPKASEYKKTAFTPQLSLGSGKAFAFCS